MAEEKLTPDSFSNEDELIAYAVKRALEGDMDFVNSITDKPLRGKAKSAIVKAKRSGKAPEAPAPSDASEPAAAAPAEAGAAEEAAGEGESAPSAPPPETPASFANDDEMIAHAVARGLAGDMEFINAIQDKALRGKAKAALVKAKRSGQKAPKTAAPAPKATPAAKPAAAPAATKAAPKKAPAAKPAGKTIKAVPGLRSKKQTEPLEKGSIWMSRRNFLSRAGWVAFFSFLGTMLLGSLRYMFPRVLFEPSTVFKAGFPGDYPPGDVSTKWVREKRTWIVRDQKGFFGIYAQCTHLGCTPRWLQAEGKFKCPCHGSGFTMEGINFEGPAPRPLERVKISLAEDGQLLIDTSIRFREEQGQWKNPESYLPYGVS